jgi:hypothetical protein
MFVFLDPLQEVEFSSASFDAVFDTQDLGNEPYA